MAKEDKVMKALKSVQQIAAKGYFQHSANEEFDTSDLSKEYNLLNHYDDYIGGSEMSKLFTMMADAVKNGTWGYLNLEVTQSSFNEYFKYLNMKKRFKLLQMQSGGALGYDGNGFTIHEHVFETLDEVQKALDNKAFL